MDQQNQVQDTRELDAIVFAAFVRAQKKFGKALKSSANPYFKSKYADLATCVESVIDGLHSEGFALTQPTEMHTEGIHVTTVLLHESGGMLMLGELFMPAIKNDPQGFGSALTYARRYSLLAAMGLAPEDDDGNLATGLTGGNGPKSIKHSPTQGSYDSLPPNRQAIIQDVADAIVERLNADDVHGAYGEYIGIEDAEEKVALWSKLDSKTRATLKKQKDEHGKS